MENFFDLFYQQPKFKEPDNNIIVPESSVQFVYESIIKSNHQVPIILNNKNKSLDFLNFYCYSSLYYLSYSLNDLFKRGTLKKHINEYIVVVCKRTNTFTNHGSEKLLITQFVET